MEPGDERDAATRLNTLSEKFNSSPPELELDAQALTSSTSFASEQQPQDLDAHLRVVLSPTAYNQLARLRNLDICHADHAYLEREFAGALRELEQVESFAATVFKGMLQIKRAQKTHEDHMIRLEEEIKNVRTEVQDLIRPMKLSYAQAEGCLRKERKALDDFKVCASDRLDALESSLGNAERKITILQTQWATTKQTFDDVNKQLVPTQELANALAIQIDDLTVKQDSVWTILREVREDVHALSQGIDDNMDTTKESEVSSLEDELRDRSEHLPDGPALNLSSVPTRGSDGWWNVPDSTVQRSRSIGTASDDDISVSQLSSLLHDGRTSGDDSISQDTNLGDMADADVVLAAPVVEAASSNDVLPQSRSPRLSIVSKHERPGRNAAAAPVLNFEQTIRPLPSEAVAAWSSKINDGKKTIVRVWGTLCITLRCHKSFSDWIWAALILPFLFVCLYYAWCITDYYWNTIVMLPDVQPHTIPDHPIWEWASSSRRG